MPRNISFALTKEQFLDRSKCVTRRMGWASLKAGDVLMGCEKCMGLKPGESIRRLGLIEVLDVRVERLDAMFIDPYGSLEAAKEGFPEMDGRQFVEMFCRHMRVDARQLVTRIEFCYLDG